MTQGWNARASIALDNTHTDLINLALLASHARWNVVGPRFASLYLLLDDVALAAHNAAGRVAERAMTLGHHPDGRPATVARDNPLPSFELGALRDVDVLEAFDTMFDIVIARLHGASDSFAEDRVTQDLLTAVAGAMERYAWLVRAHGS